MTRSWTGKAAINLVFLLGLLAPAVATLLSPRFVPFIEAALSGDHSTKVEVELLRRATPLWKGGADFYNGLLFDLGVSPNPGQLMMGSDGYTFLGNANYMAYDLDLRRYDPPPSDLDKWVDDLAYEENYLSQRGARLFFVIAPSKGTIYFDKLGAVPPGYAGTPSLFDRMLKLVAGRGLSLIDVRQDLIEARKTADTYSPLNSHWTDYGGYVAWQKIASTIQKSMPDTKLAGVDDLASVGTRYYGNEAAGLISVDKPNRWTYVVRRQPFPTYYVVTPDGRRQPVPGDTRTEFGQLPRETYSPDATSRHRLLVITDSMGAALSPYWTASFENVEQVVNQVRPWPGKLDFEGVVNDFKPDLVLYVMTERYLAVPLRPNGHRY